MRRLLFTVGLVGDIATWSPLVQALAIFGLTVVVFAATLNDKRAARLIAIIQALRGRLP